MQNIRESTSIYNTSDLQDNYALEIQILNINFNQFKRKHEEDLAKVTKQRDDAIKRVSALEPF